MTNNETFFNNTIFTLITTALLALAGCGGSLRSEYRSDWGTSVHDPLYSSTDTRGATDFCLAHINQARDQMLEDYCRITGGCSGEGATTESETTVRLSMREFCAAAPDAAVCRDLGGASLDDLPTIESTTRSRTTEPSGRTTGIDSGYAFFASSSTAAQYAMFCQQAANGLGGGMTGANPMLWSYGAMGMPFGTASGMLGLGGVGMGMNGMGGFGGGFGPAGPRGQMRYPINYLLPQDIIVTVTVMSEQGQMLSMRPSQGSGIMNDHILMARPLQGNTAVFQWQCSNGQSGSRVLPLNSDFTVTPDRCGLPAYAYTTSSY